MKRFLGISLLMLVIIFIIYWGKWKFIDDSKNDNPSVSSSVSNDELMKLNQNIYVNTLSGDSVLLKSLIPDASILIMRFSELNCELCVITEFQNLMNVGGLENDIILLASYGNVRKINAFIKSQNINYPIYLIRENGLNIDMEELNFPFYFILNDELLIDRPFLPEKSSPVISQSYLDDYKEKYLE